MTLEIEDVATGRKFKSKGYQHPIVGDYVLVKGIIKEVMSPFECLHPAIILEEVQWVPKQGDKFYYITDSVGCIVVCCDVYHKKDLRHEHREQQGNYYRTAAEASVKLEEVLKVLK